MIRRKTLVLLTVMLVSLTIASPALAAQSYYAERFDVHIDIQENGSATVTETVEFHFEGDPFTFAFREISATETDGLTFLDASMDGNPMPQGTGAGQVEVEDGDPLRVTWHFPPTSNTSHVFTVRYRADGVIRKGDGDTLIWRAVPEDHDYSIEDSTITLAYPPEATLLEQPTLDWDYDAAWEENRLILTASNIGDDEELILTARFAPDSLTQTAPQWQVRQERVRAATAQTLPFGLIAGIATLVLGGLGLFTYARSNARELSISPVVSTASPPSDVSPALIGKLTGQQHNFMGTIFDLAQRGVLEVREESGTWGTKNHILALKGDSERLESFEQGLLDAIFKRGESEVKMSDVPARLTKNNKLFDEPLEQELIQRGWLDPERKQKKSRLTAVGLMTLFGGMAAFIISLIGWRVSLSENPGWLSWIAIAAGIGAGLFFLSILFLIYAASYSILTPAGEEQAARWKGFAEYLKGVSKGREPAIRPDYFERYLAYAAVFGLGTGWAKYFEDLGGVPLPVWFHARAGSHASFGAMVAMMSASDSAGASAAGGGGAGASGGGSSGAG